MLLNFNLYTIYTSLIPSLAAQVTVLCLESDTLHMI